MTRAFVAVFLLISSLAVLGAESGIKLYRQGEYQKALPLLSEAAERGDPQAQEALGSMYFLGQGVNLDPHKALFWLEKSALQGNAGAEYLMGVHYALGLAIRQDFSRAAFWFQKAANKNHLLAQLNLADQYRSGAGVDKNLTRAAKIYRNIVDSNHASGTPGVFGALIALSEIYERGEGLEVDYVEAYKFIVAAAETEIDFVMQARSELRTKLTPSQAEEGEKRAAVWLKSKPKN